VINATLRSLYPRERNQVPTVQETGWASGRIWTIAENFYPPTGFVPRTVQHTTIRNTDYATPAHAASLSSVTYLVPHMTYSTHSLPFYHTSHHCIHRIPVPEIWRRTFPPATPMSPNDLLFSIYNTENVLIPYSCCISAHLQVSILCCPGIPYLSQDVPAYEGVLCDKAVMLRDMIKEYIVLCLTVNERL
jgi:hypothetical protein